MVWQLQDTIVAIRKGGDKLVVGNLESDKYPTIEFGTDPNQARDKLSSSSSSSMSMWGMHACMQRTLA